MAIELDNFIEANMRKGGRLVPARLQTALALLERLRDKPDLRLEAHRKSSSTGLESHETFAKKAHERLGLEIVNKTHGRRSSELLGWGQKLLDCMKAAGFEKAKSSNRNALIDAAQETFAKAIRSILEQVPLTVRLKGRSAETVIRDLLKQAEEKGKAGDVAQYLVGAKLMLRLQRDIPIHGSNKGDRKSRDDPKARTGDFEIENATIEVAVGLPDEKHLAQVVEALEDTDIEVWLLTRHDRVGTWQHEVEQFEGIDPQRVVVTAVEMFVGQNVSEMGGFSVKGKIAQLQELFKLYNERWVAKVGTPGLMIIFK